MGRPCDFYRVSCAEDARDGYRAAGSRSCCASPIAAPRTVFTSARQPRWPSSRCPIEAAPARDGAARFVVFSGRDSPGAWSSRGVPVRSLAVEPARRRRVDASPMPPGWPGRARGPVRRLEIVVEATPVRPPIGGGRRGSEGRAARSDGGGQSRGRRLAGAVHRASWRIGIPSRCHRVRAIAGRPRFMGGGSEASRRAMLGSLIARFAIDTTFVVASICFSMIARRLFRSHFISAARFSCCRSGTRL